MGKMEVYMNSLETKVQVANSSRIYECDASTICDAVFFDLEQVGYHRSAKHHKLISGYSQRLYVPEIKTILPDVLHASGLIAKATICKDTRDPLEHSSSDFNNTTSILEKVEQSSIDDTDEDSNEYIKDDSFPNNAP